MECYGKFIRKYVKEEVASIHPFHMVAMLPHLPLFALRHSIVMSSVDNGHGEVTECKNNGEVMMS